MSRLDYSIREAIDLIGEGEIDGNGREALLDVVEFGRALRRISKPHSGWTEDPLEDDAEKCCAYCGKTWPCAERRIIDELEDE